MTIFEQIKERILKMTQVERLGENPNDSRFTFINDEETIRRQELDECRIWYIGKSQEIENYYTNRDLSGNAKEPIFNRSKFNYFWAIAAEGDEQPIKKVHSGVPHAIVESLSATLGMPEITSKTYDEAIKKMLKANDFTRKLTQEARPLTMVEGYGAWKVNFDKNFMDEPIFEFYEGKDCNFVVKCGVIIGIIFQEYYRYGNMEYVFFETRRVANGNSYIEYELYRLAKDNTVTRVPLNTLPDFAGLNEYGYEIKGVNRIMAVPCRYFYDPQNKSAGRSIFAGSLDIFDDIDQTLSQMSQTCKVSTPVEYYPPDALEKDSFGRTKLPSAFNRQYVQGPENVPNGEGSTEGKIQTTQPQLNFEQYTNLYRSQIDMALIGKLSPATIGFDVSKKDNAEAQREKEKVTIYNRNSIMDAETKQIIDLITIGLMMKEYMMFGKVTIADYDDISVKYSEFASPTFETMSKILYPMWVAGAISTEMYVNKLYGDNLSDEEKLKEIADLEKNRQMDSMNLGDFDNEDSISGNIPTEDKSQAPIGKVKE